MAANVTPREFGRRFRKALSVPFLLDQVCSPTVKEFVTSYADSLGCTDKCFFFPLLTCTASCMGTDAHVQLTSNWKEPLVIWTLVLTPKSLLRIDVAEHLKQLVLQAQNEAWVLGKGEDTKDHLKKFLFDAFTLGQLQDMLKLSNGHGLAIYNSVRALHKNLQTPEDADVMLRLHSGLAWFGDSRVNRNTVTKTCVNFAVISTPSTVQQTLASAPNFQELFHQTFLTTCVEENHVKFGQITEFLEENNLKEMFVSLLKLHFGNEPIVYKLSEEAKEKFSQIHDELTDKAKQMSRKSAHKVYQPALAYLGRLSCILHVLENIIDAINYKVPVSRLTWNTEISSATVWYARELLGHIIEQRHALMEPTTIENPQQRTAPTTEITVSDVQVQRSNIQNVRNVARNNVMSPARTPVQTSPRFLLSHQPFAFNNNNNVRRNLMNNRFRNSPSSLSNGINPIISSVSSAGLPVSQPLVAPTKEPSNGALGLNLPSTLSVSTLSAVVSDDMDTSEPVLLSRAPFTSVLDMSEQEFLSSHKSSIRKLLKHSSGEISASRCVQLKLVSDPTASDDQSRYSLGFARSFLKKLESLGFGICDGPKTGSMRHFVFKKKKFSALGDEQKQILTELTLSEADYNKCFTNVPSKEQNGSVVCLE